MDAAGPRLAGAARPFPFAAALDGWSARDGAGQLTRKQGRQIKTAHPGIKNGVTTEIRNLKSCGVLTKRFQRVLDGSVSFVDFLLAEQHDVVRQHVEQHLLFSPLG